MIDLSKCEKRVYSQNGEDGVIAAIFDAIGTTNKVSLEFGSHPQECNTKLLHEQGWDATCWDLHPYGESWFRQEHISPSNINALFDKHEIPSKFDFLSIDVDGNDFHLWHALRHQIQPRVVCIEHNSALQGFADLVVPLSEQFTWDGSNYFGASLVAMAQLGRKRGYTLVYVEKTGVNAFFVRDECLQPEMFRNQGNVTQLFVPPAYGDGGHPKDPFNRPYQTSWEYLRFSWKA